MTSTIYKKPKGTIDLFDNDYNKFLLKLQFLN